VIEHIDVHADAPHMLLGGHAEGLQVDAPGTAEGSFEQGVQGEGPLVVCALHLVQEGHAAEVHVQLELALVGPGCGRCAQVAGHVGQHLRLAQGHRHSAPIRAEGQLHVAALVGPPAVEALILLHRQLDEIPLRLRLARLEEIGVHKHPDFALFWIRFV